MSQAHAEQSVPPAFLIAAGILILVTIIASAYVRWTGNGAVMVAPSPAVMAASLRFEDGAGGSVIVHSVPVSSPGTAPEVHRIAPGEDNFIRGTMRTFARDRKRQHVGTDAPFVLTYRADGRLSLDDPSTGRKVDLEAFGPVNSSAFARLLGPAPTTELHKLAHSSASPRVAAPH